MSDDDLRTALTKLADEIESREQPDAVWPIVDMFRDLLAAHPARTPDEDKWSHFATEREEVASAIEQAIPAEYVPGFRFRYALDAADAVLRVLPAPPVVDETVLRDLILKVDDEGGWSNIFPDEATALAAEIDARLRGATRG